VIECDSVRLINDCYALCIVRYLHGLSIQSLSLLAMIIIGIIEITQPLHIFYKKYVCKKHEAEVRQ